jgi:galactose-1-phosphate uridylyltransferase
MMSGSDFIRIISSLSDSYGSVNPQHSSYIMFCNQVIPEIEHHKFSVVFYSNLRIGCTKPLQFIFIIC